MSASAVSRLAAGLGFLAVALGAFGAHGLHPLLERHQTVAVWQTAVFYHFIHAVMLFLLAGRKPLAVGPCVAFGAGILVFSGSLYLLAVTGCQWLGAVTPLGGLALLTGWAWLVIKPSAAS